MRQTIPCKPVRTIWRAMIPVIALVIAAGPAAGAAESPDVTPATGGAGVPLVFGAFEDTDAIGYETTEYLVSGEAHAYTTAAPLTPDGRWDAVSARADTAPYTTRVIVYAPRKKRHFDGTVFVEWLNVSGFVDAAPDWTHGHLQVRRQGAAYVLVSAQAVGVDQLKNGNFLAPGDPDRYGSLSHPGDSYAYDIFSQVGQAVRDGKLLGRLRPRRVVALGESQSALRLVTYIDAIHPVVGVYDGFLVHSRFPGGAPLSQRPLPQLNVSQADIRDDVDVPVLVFQAEGDVALSGLLTRQPEDPHGNVRIWEVAGTAHFDVYGLNIGPFDAGRGRGEIENFAAMQDPPAAPQPGIIECAEGINAGPMHWVFNAALHWIDRWVRSGQAPPIAPRLQALTAPGVTPVVFALDEHGNTRGGIRTPLVDVPVAVLLGTGNTGAPGAPPTSAFCFLFGQTVPFDDERLAEAYPTHGRFVVRYLLATWQALRSQYLLWPDAVALFRAAALSDVGR